MTVSCGKSPSRQACRKGASSVCDVLMVGPFPPPVHGFAQATQDIAEFFETGGLGVLRIDLSPIREKRGILFRTRVRLSQLAQLRSAVRRGCRVYVGLSGGIRQAVDLAFIAIARLGKARLYVHHHSFAYLDRPTMLARICFLVSGRFTTHIVLCDGMKAIMTKQYKVVHNVEVISNAHLKSVCLPFIQRTAVRRIGYFSALTEEKGILEFLNVATTLAGRHCELHFSIAGPCDDANIREAVGSACLACAGLEYIGPVYGGEKRAFLESLDVLLFPTTYHNEADPLVIWEAMSSGIPIIAWERGCIGEMLEWGEVPSASIPRDSRFVPVAVSKIESWLLVPEVYRQSSVLARSQFEKVSYLARLNLKRIFLDR
jgi:glycosyltransferase involved in cell wall biosynthesis